MLYCLSDPDSAFQNKLKLPAPSVAVSKAHTDTSAKSTADDDAGNMHSSLLAGMLRICSTVMFHILKFRLICVCFNVI